MKAVEGARARVAAMRRPLLAAAAAALAQLEKDLLDGPGATIEFTLVTEGTRHLDLRGRLYLGAEQQVRVEAKGDFDGRALDLVYVCDGKLCDLKQYEATTMGMMTEAAGAHLREAIVYPLVRSGFVYILGPLANRLPPAHASQPWSDAIVAQDPHFAAAAAGANGADDDASLDYTLVLGGKPAGEGSLTLGRRDATRRLTVRSPEGELRVVETYRIRSGAPAPKLFVRQRPPRPPYSSPKRFSLS
jgi:hypothetical protein